MKKLILTACLASCLATTPYAAQAMQPSSGLKAYYGKTTKWVSQHKIASTSIGLCTVGLMFIIAALTIAPTITEIFNAEEAEKDSDGCWFGCELIQERIRKIQKARQFFVLGVACLLAGGCTLGCGTWWKDKKAAQASLKSLTGAQQSAARFSSTESLPMPLPTTSNIQKTNDAAQQQQTKPLTQPSTVVTQQHNEQKLNQELDAIFEQEKAQNAALKNSDHALEAVTSPAAANAKKGSTSTANTVAAGTVSSNTQMESLLTQAIEALAQTVTGKSDNDKVDATDDIMPQIAALPSEQQQQQTLAYLKQQLGLQQNAQQELDRALATALDMTQRLK